jgi:hypothetical protein
LAFILLPQRRRGLDRQRLHPTHPSASMINNTPAESGIEGSEIEHDVLVRLSGEIKKRKKKLSKAV